MANDKKAVVAIAKEPTVQESVTKVFDLLGGVTNMIPVCSKMSFTGRIKQVIFIRRQQPACCPAQ